MLLILIQRTRHSVWYPCQITRQGPHTQSGILAKSEDKVQATEFPAISSAQPSNTGTKGEVTTSKMCPLIRIFITRKFNSCLRLSWLFCCCQKHRDRCMTQVSPPGESAEQRESTPSWKPPKMSEMKHSHHMAGWLLHARRHTHTHMHTQCNAHVIFLWFTEYEISYSRYVRNLFSQDWWKWEKQSLYTAENTDPQVTKKQILQIASPDETEDLHVHTCTHTQITYIYMHITYPAVRIRVCGLQEHQSNPASTKSVSIFKKCPSWALHRKRAAVQL